MSELDHQVLAWASHGYRPGEIWQRCGEADTIADVERSLARLKAAGKLPEGYEWEVAP